MFFLYEVLSTIFYSAFGLLVMWIAWKAIDIMTPFSIVEDIEGKQNMALAVLIGCLFIAIAIIIGSVIVS